MVNPRRLPNTTQINQCVSSDAIRHNTEMKMGALLTPGYLSRAKRPKLMKTEKTNRFHSLDMELFLAEGQSISHCSKAGPSKPRINVLATSVYRTVNVPENYSLMHLAAVSSFLMGWPLETSFDIWLRGTSVSPSSSADKAKPMDGAAGLEIWLCLAPPDDIDDTWTVVPFVNRKSSLRSSIRLYEIWGRDKTHRNQARINPLMKQPHLTPGQLCIRIKCESAGIHNPHFPIDEPFGIGGCGAPPAPAVPRFRNGAIELREQWESKRFEGWSFEYEFWNFIHGKTVSEVDVEGVHVWKTDSNEFRKRLEVLERRASGNWLADLEEYVLDFS